MKHSGPDMPLVLQSLEHSLCTVRMRVPDMQFFGLGGCGCAKGSCKTTKSSARRYGTVI